MLPPGPLGRRPLVGGALTSVGEMQTRSVAVLDITNIFAKLEVSERSAAIDRAGCGSRVTCGALPPHKGPGPPNRVLAHALLAWRQQLKALEDRLGERARPHALGAIGGLDQGREHTCSPVARHRPDEPPPRPGRIGGAGAGLA